MSGTLIITFLICLKKRSLGCVVFELLFLKIFKNFLEDESNKDFKKPVSLKLAFFLKK